MDLGHAGGRHSPLLRESLDLGDVQSRPFGSRAPARVALEIRRLIPGASYRRDPAETEPYVDQFVGGQRPGVDALASQSQPDCPSLWTGGLEEILDLSHSGSVQDGLAVAPLQDTTLGAPRPHLGRPQPPGAEPISRVSLSRLAGRR